MIDMMLVQTTLLEKAIIRAGSVGSLAKILSVRRETVTRWYHGRHRMNSHSYMELLAWLETEERDKKSIGNLKNLTAI